MSALLIRLLIVVLAIMITIQGMVAYLRKREVGYLFIAASAGLIPVLLGVLFYLVFRGALRVPRTAESAAFEHVLKTVIICVEYISISIGLFLLSKGQDKSKTNGTSGECSATRENAEKCENQP